MTEDVTATLPLRDRKRLSAMRRIQTVALDLFEEHGFDNVTVEQIAAASEVSPSSVYRYFGTKEQLVIWDEYDPAALATIAEQLEEHGPLEAIRRVTMAIMSQAFSDDEERIRRRLRIAFENPSVEAASALQAYEMSGLIAAVLAQKLQRPPDDLHVQVVAHAYVGAFMGAFRHWYLSGFTTSFPDGVAHAIELVEGGLHFD